MATKSGLTPPFTLGQPLRMVGGSPGTAALALMLALASALLLELRSHPRDDVSWLLHVAASWLDGGRPYLDLVEINPPTVIWLSMLPVMLARGLGTPMLATGSAFFAVMVLGCAWITAGILRRNGTFADRAAAFGAIGAVLLLLPLREFGQREHLIAAASLPMLALLTGRAPAGGAGWRDALLAGALAGLCCGIKPHYTLGFAAALAVAALLGRRPPLAALLAAAATLLALAAAMLVWTPAYLDYAVPLAVELYLPHRDGILFTRPTVAAMLAGGGAALLCWRDRRRFGERDGGAALVLLAFAAGAWLAYLIQGKGWFYQRIPALVLTALAVLAWSATRPRPADEERLPRRGSWRLALPPALLTLTLLAGATGEAGHMTLQRISWTRSSHPADEARLAAALRRAGATSYVAYTAALSGGFPLVDVIGASWGSRFASTWALAAESQLARQRTDPDAARPVREQVVSDFLRSCPEFVAVGWAEEVDYLAVLAGDGKRFRDAWARYRPVDRFGRFELHARPRGPGADDCGATG